MGKKQTFELKSSSGVDGQVTSRYKHDPDLQIEDTGEIISEDTRMNDKEKIKTVSLRSVLRFADTWDYFYTTVATIASVIHGTFMPLLMLIFGEIVDMFLEDSNGHKKLDQIPWNMYNTTKDDALNDQESLKLILEHENRTEWIDAVNVEILKDLTGYMNRYALYAIYMALAVIVMAYLQTSLWFRTSQRQGQKIRAAAFRSIMRQDMAWFDTHKSSELNNRLSEDINVIVAGIGDRVGMFVQWVSAAIAGMLIGFFSGWKLSLVVCGIVPLITLVGALTAKKVASSTIKEMNAYAEAGAVAEETIASFRTVLSFGGENKECERYAKKLRTACSIGIKKGYVQGAGPGLILGIIYGSYGICFWYGAKLIHDNEYTPGEMLTIFYAVLVGAFSLSYAFPNLQYISEGKGAASTIWNIIDSIPAIDWTLSTGACPSRCYGNIQFNNVKFAYPSRKNINVLKNVSFDVTQGQTVALVGASGCGKSTAVQLIQRFYDPDDGYIEVDGVNIRELNTQWLREQIGVVSQEPVLFGTTISQNIRFGREDVTQEEIEDACRKSNAYEFIERLPNKYETLVGERGAQLSGGQKQRIAIARALVRDPKILLLDEATSALDTESEALVQSALDKAREGRTTIVIAHRLSTIKTADIICGFDDGKIVEQGTHEKLMELNNGIYCQLVKNQTSDDSEDNTVEVVDPVNITLNDKDVVIDDVDDEVSSSVEHKMKKSSKVSGFTWAFKQSGPEKYYIVAGCISAILYGLKQPAYAIIFAELFAVFELPQEEQMSEVLKNCYLFLGVGAIAGIAIFLQHAMFNYSGTCLTKRLRTKAFTHLLRQDVAFFDKPENNTGAVISNLAKDTMAIQGATGAQLGMMLQGIAGMGSGAIIGFVYSWKMALGSVAFVPCIFFGGILTSRLRTDTSEGGKSALQDAAMLGFQAIENVKTVTSLSRHEWFINNYITQTLNTCKKAVKGSHLHGAVYACSQSFVFFAYGGSFYLGAYLIEEGELSFVNMMKVFMSIVFGALAMGNATRYMPSLSEGQQAAESLHKLFKNKPKINGQKGVGKKISNVTGKLEFRSVMFNYPSRHTVPVLKSFNLTVQPGDMVAFVGSSGCGKSTTVQLIERFYDTLDGAIYLDDEPIKSLDVGYLRSNFGLVSQEPVLFDTSIAENIAYGDNTRVVPMEEIIEAARKANIHDFIHKLPQGYATNVGSKGTQLSGGQKQRVAIARALIRDPKVLLLDEATSALDSESEKIVQEALEVAQQGRTSIVIAHRLSTIVNADKIVVFHRGRIVEAGTHSELLTEKGFYYRLNQAQIRTK